MLFDNNNNSFIKYQIFCFSATFTDICVKKTVEHAYLAQIFVGSLFAGHNLIGKTWLQSRPPRKHLGGPAVYLGGPAAINIYASYANDVSQAGRDSASLA